MCSRATGASEKTRPGMWSGPRRRGELYPISVVTNISSDKEWLIAGGEGEKVHTRFSKFLLELVHMDLYFKEEKEVK